MEKSIDDRKLSDVTKPQPEIESPARGRNRASPHGFSMSPGEANPFAQAAQSPQLASALKDDNEEDPDFEMLQLQDDDFEEEKEGRNPFESDQLKMSDEHAHVDHQLKVEKRADLLAVTLNAIIEERQGLNRGASSGLKSTRR